MIPILEHRRQPRETGQKMTLSRYSQLVHAPPPNAGESAREAELSLSEEWFRTIFEEANDGIVIADPETRRLRLVNRKACKLLGYTWEKMLTMEVADLFTAESRSLGLAEFAAQIRGEKSITRSIPIVRCDGQIIYVDISSSKLNIRGETYIAGFFRDITDRRRAEDLLHAQHDLMASLSQLRSLPETLKLCLQSAIKVSGLDCCGIYLAQDDGAMKLTASTGFSYDFVEATLYYPADAANSKLIMAGKPVYVCYPDLGIPLTSAELHESLRALAIIPIFLENRIIGSLNVASHALDDVPHHSRVALETIASSIGMLIGRARTDESLQIRDERLRLAQIKGRIGLWEWNFKTNRAVWSEESEKLYGLPPGGFGGRHEDWLALIHPDNRPGIEAAIQEWFYDPGPFEIEFRVPLPSGGERWILSKGDMIRDREGQPWSLLGVNVDITERKRTEEKLIIISRELRMLHARFAELEEEKRKDLARELHDQIGTELSAMGMGLNAARHRVEQGEIATLSTLLMRLEDQAEQIARNVRHFITDLRPEALYDFGIMPALRVLAGRVSECTGLKIQVNGPEELRQPMSTETCMYRIVQEALANVSKHARASCVSVDLVPTDKGVRLTVRDDGCGFDPIAPRTASIGQGLGLIDMRERATAIGGRFTVHAAPGHGTVLVVEVGLTPDLPDSPEREGGDHEGPHRR